MDLSDWTDEELDVEFRFVEACIERHHQAELALGRRSSEIVAEQINRLAKPRGE